MRSPRSLPTRLFTMLLCLLVLPVALRAEEVSEYIAIRKAGVERISVVLDHVRSVGVQQSAWARSLDETIRVGLDYTGLFNLMGAPLNIRNPQDGSLNLGAVGSVGADVLVTGGVTAQNGIPALEMQVWDSTGKVLLSRKYTGPESALRQIGQRFCADLVQLLTGKRSVFGTSIVFISNRTGSKEVYSCDFDGQNIRQLTDTKTISLTPSVSSDGRFLAWTDYLSGRPDLYIRDIVTGTTASVRKQGVCISPAWLPGADKCATTLSHEGMQDIYLIRADGTVDRRLTSGRSIEVSPSFSPDGSQMAFVSTREGPPQIFIQNIVSGAVRRLTYSGTYNTQPAWSPDGDKILYSSLQKNGEINIFAINTDGAGLLQLTSGSRNNEHPSWSPDGSMIVFSSTRDGRRRLYVMNADGTNQRPLLQMPGEQQQPSWSADSKRF